MQALISSGANCFLCLLPWSKCHGSTLLYLENPAKGKENSNNDAVRDAAFMVQVRFAFKRSVARDLKCPLWPSPCLPLSSYLLPSLPCTLYSGNSKPSKVLILPKQTHALSFPSVFVFFPLRFCLSLSFTWNALFSITASHPSLSPVFLLRLYTGEISKKRSSLSLVNPALFLLIGVHVRYCFITVSLIRLWTPQEQILNLLYLYFSDA